MRELSSPKSVATAAKMLEQINHEWRDMHDGYNMAVRRHGPIVQAPKPYAAIEASVEAPSERNEPKVGLDIANLIARYKADVNCGYSRLRFRTREHYDGLMRRIDADCGKRELSALKARDFKKFYEDWTTSGEPMAHALVGMLRTLVNFGATTLENGECERLAGVLHGLRFKRSKRQNNEQLTEAHVDAIIRTAYEWNLPSLALAQALQFECGLRQRDVIGEWIPDTEPGESDVRRDGMKWLRGILWDEIDKDFVLRHPASKGGKLVELRLSKYPRVKAAFAKVKQQFVGPVIVHEETDFPYKAHDFRTLWRKAARAAGVPDKIKNMDSRSSSARSETNGAHPPRLIADAIAALSPEGEEVSID